MVALWLPFRRGKKGSLKKTQAQENILDPCWLVASTCGVYQLIASSFGSLGRATARGIPMCRKGSKREALTRPVKRFVGSG